MSLWKGRWGVRRELERFCGEPRRISDKLVGRGRAQVCKIEVRDA